MNSNQNSSILHDNLWKLMIHLSLPGIIGMSIISSGSFIDAVFLGQFIGYEAVAAISLVFPLTIINSSIISLIAVGTSSVFSRALGAQDTHTLLKVFGSLTLLSIGLSALVSIPTMWFSRALLSWMGGTGNVLEYGIKYYQIIMAGLIFSVFGLSSNALIRAEGNIRRAMIFAGAAVVINGIFTPILINVLNWGIEGAALSTVFSMVIYSLLNLNYFYSGKSAISLNSLRISPSSELIWEFLTIGFSAFLMQGVNFIRQIFIFRSIAFYGQADDIAFLGATVRLFTFALIPVFGILQALQPVIGINYGAGNLQRAKRAVGVFRLGAMMMLVFIVLPALLFPEFILSIILPDHYFSQNDLFNFRLLMSLLPIIPFASTGMVFFQAIGKGSIASYLSLSRELIFIPIILVFPVFLSTNGIYYGIFLENILYVILVYVVTHLIVSKMDPLQTKV